MAARRNGRKRGRTGARGTRREKRAAKEEEQQGPDNREQAASTSRRSRSAPAAREGRAGAAPRLVVGIGASAGGLSAMSELLPGLPPRAGLSVVFVTHLDPSQQSTLAELLSRTSALPVLPAEDGQRLERDHVYVIRPDTFLEVRDGCLRATPRPDVPIPLPIDHLFRSLAQHYGSHAIAVVLSGNASDGAAGIRDVKAAGGLVIAQDPDTAEHDGMPRAAIATGAVDLVLAPERIAREIADAVRRPPPDDGEIDRSRQELARVFSLLYAAHGVDFSQYKLPTIRRRIQRRMAARKAERLERYLELLEEEPAELAQLGEDLLIQVTRFFREPAAFECLDEIVFPKLLEASSQEHPLRVWIPGCASGEEAYSVAIALMEQMRRAGRARVLQIFATDVSEHAIERARAGFYPSGIDADVPPALLRRYFAPLEDGYRISPAVRETCIFARQDLIRDPPFSHLDLVLCRNLLIYLEPPAQQRAIRVFHYALRPDGFLLLGESETIGDQSHLFAIVERKHKLYTKRPVETPLHVGGDEARFGRAALAAPRRAAARPSHSLLAQRILLERYARPAVLVDPDSLVLEIHGRTGRYLELPSGSASLSVVKLARPGLAVGMRSALAESRKRGTTVRRSGLRVKVNGSSAKVDIVVIPVGEEGAAQRHLIVFEEAAQAPTPALGDARPKASRGRSRARGKPVVAARVAELQQELDETRSHMQAAIQDLEATNEELQSANEEILSSNEELQSTNEELDTAREELQSTNEEIGTVNEELRTRNDDLLRLNSDLENLLSHIQIAIVIVSEDLRIRRFTAAAEKLLNLIHADLGRPIGQIKPRIDLPDLNELIRRVVDGVDPYECEVRGDRGQWYSLRIRPYKDVENRIDGAVLSLMDVTQLKEHEITARAAQALADAMLDAVRDALVVLDGDLRVLRVNDEFRARFRVSDEEIGGRLFYELGSGRWDIPDLRRLLEDVLPTGREVDGYLVAADFPRVGPQRIRVNARRIEVSDGMLRVLLAMRDD